MLHVWTAHSEYPGPHKLDVQSGPFAPTNDLEERMDVWDMSIDEYFTEYRGQMRESYRRHKDLWNEVLSSSKIVLTCDCDQANGCHRTELAKILGELGAAVHGELVEWDTRPIDAPFWVSHRLVMGTAILVTGDRSWTDVVAVRRRLWTYPRCSMLIHGDCSGLDRMAARVGAEIGMTIVPMAPNLEDHGAGKFTKRNSVMLDMLSSLRWCNWRTYVEAFVLPTSRGTWDTVNKAKKLGFEPHVTKGEGDGQS